ncbi:MAG TPA: ATP-binding protein [Pirellulales bacterium]|nr:ATP-binding protein [Pirellulales bacterium]
MLAGDSSEPGPEQQVELLKQQLAAAQKMAALGELVGTTTHEFNNVLMTIINYAKMGLRHHDAATRDKAFNKILSASQRAARITNGVLGFARGRSQGFEPVDLAKLVVDTLELLEREMTKYRVKVETHLQPTPTVCANRSQVQQILMNLLINARQAMPQGGRLFVSLAHDPALDMVELAVRDNGSGIAPEHLRKIFDPFFTTKSGPDASGKGGTGLGLAACRDIVEAHRGKIRVESTVGLGTAFIIKLPVASERPSTSVASGSWPVGSNQLDSQLPALP